MRLLVVAAHVDDEALLCGGTIARATRRGHAVEVVFCSRNEQGRCAGETLSERRRRAETEAAASAALLGFAYRFLDFEDMLLAEQPGRLQQALIETLRDLRPEVVITHAPKDWHADHRALAAVVPEAAFQSGRGVAGGLPWRPAAVLHGEVDIEDLAPLPYQAVARLDAADYEARAAAVEAYVSVASEHDVDGGWLREALRARARSRGALIGAEYGEAFAVARQLTLDAAALRLLAELLS